MTTAHRPTFEPARGGQGRNEGDLAKLSQQFSARDMPSHTKLKYRQGAQTANYIKPTSTASADKPSIASFDKPASANLDKHSHFDADDSIDEPTNVDSDASGNEDSDEEEEEEEDEAALMAELAEIKKERQAERAEKEAREKAEKASEDSICCFSKWSTNASNFLGAHTP